MPRLNFYKIVSGGPWYARDLAGDVHYPDWNWTEDNSGVSKGVRIKATHVQDLRNRTKDFRGTMVYCSCTCDCTCTCECQCTCTCTCTCNFCFG